VIEVAVSLLLTPLDVEITFLKFAGFAGLYLSSTSPAPARSHRDSYWRSIVNVILTETSFVRTYRADIPNLRRLTSTHIPYTNVSRCRHKSLRSCYIRVRRTEILV
jgi:hypothetical protein